ncbi:MAG TPA: PfkB family carbohydrate kinase [Aggregatilinea sp.]|uniref:carbohydrate kinase family protein n=1 Tax=Aggregatilinea sp. TaxID=2806333 RepID=UPI002CE846E6|nr:PfkB family carbohydrate kinase [Aggregatilinea sp.]HML20527.1 PfkB family carbohydrate kinase [Aggregatilinea sp.]
MKDVLATGYPSLDYIAHVSHLPEVGQTAILRSLPDEPEFGGCGANVAAALATLGFSTGLAMILGDDDQGDAYMRHLAASGINADNVIRLAGERTSRSTLYFDPDYQHTDFFFAGAADAWQGALELVAPEQYRYALLTVGPLGYNRQFAQQVRAAGVPLVWGMKPDIHAFTPGAIRDLMAASSYVVMNHIEARYVLDAMGSKTLETCLSDVTRGIVVTQGAADSVVITHEGRKMAPCVRVDTIVDPTGAGDGFMAGFLAGLLRGCSPETGARLGAVIASFVLEKLGCQTNLPTWEQAMARYAQHFGPFETPNKFETSDREVEA